LFWVSPPARSAPASPAPTDRPTGPIRATAPPNGQARQEFRSLRGRLGTIAEAEIGALAFDWKPEEFAILNNGHTIQANVAGKSGVTLDRAFYELKQFRFQTPREHAIDGKRAGAQRQRLGHRRSATICLTSKGTAAVLCSCKEKSLARNGRAAPPGFTGEPT
jgi:hypothetical protein